MNTRSSVRKITKAFETDDKPAAANATDPNQNIDNFGQSAAVSEPADLSVTTKMLRLEGGLYALSIGQTISGSHLHGNIVLPALHISTPPPRNGSGVQIIGSSSDSTGWLGLDGGTVVVKVPAGGGHVLITTYQRHAEPADRREVAISRIDQPTPKLVQAKVRRAVEPQLQTIAIEALLHIEGTGDCRTLAEGWIGAHGKKLRLEAFGIRPIEILDPSDIEYKAYGPNGRETPWTSDGKLCGTRGRSLPLTGFAVRVAPHLADRCGIEYQGAFFESGICGPSRDGAPCMARIADDPLEAINLRLFQRTDL